MGGTSRQSLWPILLLGFFSAAVIIYSTVNLLSMNRETSETTMEYAGEFTTQLTEAVVTELDNQCVMITTLADSLSRIQDFDDLDPERIREFLERKRDLCGFYSMEFIYLSSGLRVSAGMLPPSLARNVSSTPVDQLIRDALETNGCVVSCWDESLIYAMPVSQNGTTVGVLWGSDSKETLQELIHTHIFQLGTYSCIVDPSGSIVLASGDDPYFDALEKALQDPDSPVWVEPLLHRPEGGVLTFPSSINGTTCLAYAPLEINDWLVMTSIPYDLFSSLSNRYILRALICVFATVLIFIAVFFTLNRVYRRNSHLLESMAFGDEVTGGINNTAFKRRYQKLRQDGCADQYVIVLLDAIDFKLINGRYGISYGDQVLREIYQVITGSLREEQGEFATRSETDHFFLCLRERREEAVRQRIGDVLTGFDQLQDSGLPPLHFRQGASFVPDNETDVSIVQDQARVALKSAPPDQADRCMFFNEALAGKLQRERALNKQFEPSLRNGDFQVYFQPKVSLDGQRVCGAEALVRWNYPGLGMVPPLDFIPLLEKNGKIQALDLYVFEKVCAWLHDRQAAGKPLFPISVNLSRSHFADEYFLDKFVAAADWYHVDKRLIEFEITEMIFVDTENIQRVKEGIWKMHQFGFQCSIDDFGVGYSSLSTIREFDVDTLKLDRSFFLSLEDRKARRIIRSIAELAQALNIRIVAEGIETPSQIDYLRQIHIDLVQGYYFSKPLPIPEFEAWAARFRFPEDSAPDAEQRA